MCSTSSPCLGKGGLNESTYSRNFHQWQRDFNDRICFFASDNRIFLSSGEIFPDRHIVFSGIGTAPILTTLLRKAGDRIFDDGVERSCGQRRERCDEKGHIFEIFGGTGQSLGADEW